MRMQMPTQVTTMTMGLGVTAKAQVPVVSIDLKTAINESIQALTTKQRSVRTQIQRGTPGAQGLLRRGWLITVPRMANPAEAASAAVAISIKGSERLATSCTLLRKL